MEINNPEVLAEVQAAFDAYEVALTTNDVETLDALFWNSDHTIRYGAAENLYGHDEISAFRASRPSAGLMRTQVKPRVTTFGNDFAVTSTMFTRENAAGKIGRQSQSWFRSPEGWRIVSAHVSVIAE
jgi:hypothetical protein